MKTLFTVEECAEQIGKSSRTVYRYLNDKTLEGVMEKTKKGRQRYITVESVAKFIRKRSQEVKKNNEQGRINDFKENGGF